MTIGYFTDCEDCENYENEDECLGCVHYDDWVDKFVPISSGKKAERANEQKREFLSKMMKDEVFINLTPEFADRLKLAWKFVPKVEKENDKFYCVYCDQEGLTASDTHRLIRVEADCPKELLNRHLIWDEIEGKAYLRPTGFQSALSNGRAQELLNEPKRYEVRFRKGNIPFKDIENNLHPNEEQLIIDGIVKFKKSYIDDALACIPDDEEITVKYGGKIDNAVIYAKGFKYLVMPIRY